MKTIKIILAIIGILVLGVIFVTFSGLIKFHPLTWLRSPGYGMVLAVESNNVVIALVDTEVGLVTFPMHVSPAEMARYKMDIPGQKFPVSVGYEIVGREKIPLRRTVDGFISLNRKLLERRGIKNWKEVDIHLEHITFEKRKVYYRTWLGNYKTPQMKFSTK